MKTIITSLSTLFAIGLISACAQSEFSGESGQAVKNGVPPPSDTPTKTTPGTPPTGNDNGLKTDDGDKIELVDADIKVDRLPDSASFQNCLSAHVIGQPIIDLGCNRIRPKPPGPHDSDPRPQLQRDVKIKLLTNTCNQLRVYFKTNEGRGFYNNVSTATGPITSGPSKNGTGARGPGINVIKEAGGSYLIEANDNNDVYWHDVYLRVTPPANRSNIKFTIENSGIPCG